MRQLYRRLRGHTLLCSLCGHALAWGQEYWILNGTVICPDCLADFARAELTPYRRTRGKEVRP